MQIENSEKVVEKRGFENTLLYIFTFLMILSVNSVYFSTHTGRNVITVLIMILALVLSAQSLSILKKKDIPQIGLVNWYIYYVFVTAIFFLVQSYKPLGLGSTTILELFVFPILILPYVYMEKKTSYTGFFNKYKNIVLILSVVSLIFWIMALAGVPTNVTKTVNWGRLRPVSGYFNLDYIAQSGNINFLGISLVRNTGIFVEAPMYSFILSIALMIHLFADKDSKIFDWQTILLTLTILSTTSTTGLIVLLLAVFIRMMRRLKGFWKILLVILVPILIYLFIAILNMKIDNASSNDMTSSFNIRMNDFYAGFMTWKDSPFWGNGLNNVGALNTYMNPLRLLISGNSGFSSGAMEMLALGGIYYFFFWLLLPLIRYARKNINQLCIATLFFLLLLVTIADGTYLYLFIILYFLI